MKKFSSRDSHEEIVKRLSLRDYLRDYEDIIKIIPNSKLIEVDQTVFSVFTGNHIETLNNIDHLSSSGVSALELIRVFLKWSINLKLANASSQL